MVSVNPADPTAWPKFVQYNGPRFSAPKYADINDNGERSDPVGWMVRFCLNTNTRMGESGSWR